MEHIFGAAFVCPDVRVANKLIFDYGVGNLAVTLEGDKVNRSGELSGGGTGIALVLPRPRQMPSLLLH